MNIDDKVLPGQIRLTENKKAFVIILNSAYDLSGGDYSHYNVFDTATGKLLGKHCEMSFQIKQCYPHILNMEGVAYGIRSALILSE